MPYFGEISLMGDGKVDLWIPHKERKPRLSGGARKLFPAPPPGRSYRLTFGKYTGRTITEIYHLDPDYLEEILREGWGSDWIRTKITNFLMRAGRRSKANS